MTKPLLTATLAAALAAALVAATPARSQPASPAAPNYVQLVDLVLAAPVIVKASVVRARRVPDREAPGLTPGRARLLLSMRTEAVLVAPDVVPQALEWLLDVPLERGRKPPDLRGETVIAFLQPADTRGRTTLIAGNGWQPWSPALEARLRGIATEIRAGQAPMVIGVSNGFRVPGTIPGEAESQFFLTTTDGKPLTLVVLDRPGQRRQIQVANTDIIDESATLVQPETLLWYRLACALPARLPREAGGTDPALAEAWSSAITSLGPCNR